MKKIILVLLGATVLQAKVYMAQIQPYEKIEVVSETSGLIVNINRTQEFAYVSGSKSIVEVEKEREEIELSGLKKSLHLSQKIYKLKKSNFQSKNRVKQISRYEKNLEEGSVYEIQNSIVELQKNIKLLEYQKKKKSFFVKDKYINRIFVREGDYVDVGTKIMEVYDISKSKIELYIRASEIKNISEKTIMIDGKSSSFKIEKISMVRDSHNLSSFLVRLVKDAVSLEGYFGDVVKVEFK